MASDEIISLYQNPDVVGSGENLLSRQRSEIVYKDKSVELIRRGSSYYTLIHKDAAIEMKRDIGGFDKDVLP